MSITSIGSASSFATSQLSGLSPFTNRQNVDGAATGGPQKGGFGRFASAVSDALASLGITLDGGGATTDGSTTAATTATTGTTTTVTGGTDTSSTADGSDDAVGAFLQSLFAALHAQSAGSTPPPPAGGDPSSQDGTSPVQAATSSTTGTASAAEATGQAAKVGRAHHGHGGKLAADLQSLIQELDASSTTGTTSTDAATDPTGGTTTAAATTGTTGTDSTLATLEKTFDTLLAKSGATSTGGDALQTFLQSLAQGLHGAPATGNVVSTAA